MASRHYVHEEDDKYFSKAFATFAELRKNNVMTDIVLSTLNDPQTLKKVNGCESFNSEIENTIEDINNMEVSNYLCVLVRVEYKYIISKICTTFHFIVKLIVISAYRCTRSQNGLNCGIRLFQNHV